MLAEVAQHAEHRLFLSATPHNGFTASFSGLLELLDPVRFRQTSELTDAERRQVELVMVRRLKSELNERARAARRGAAVHRSRTSSGIPFTWTPRRAAHSSRRCASTVAPATPSSRRSGTASAASAASSSRC